MKKKSKDILIITLSICFCLVLLAINLLIHSPFAKRRRQDFPKCTYQNLHKEYVRNKEKFPDNLDIFPPNYLEVIEENNLNIVQKNRVELLRYGKTVVNQKRTGNYQNVLHSLLNTNTPILLNNQILSIYFETEIDDIKNELMQKDFKNRRKLFEKISKKKVIEIEYIEDLLENSTDVFNNSLSANDMSVVSTIQSRGHTTEKLESSSKIEVDINKNLLNRMIDLSQYLVNQLERMGIKNSKLLELEKNLLSLKDENVKKEVLEKILLSQQYNLDNVQILLTTVKEGDSYNLFATPYIAKIPILPEINENNILEEYDVEPLPLQEGEIRLPIMMYHNISEPIPDDPYLLYVSPEIFERQVAYLVKKNYKILSVEEFNSILESGVTPKQKSILLTFDDATPTHYSVAYPVLKKYGQTGTFFMIASRSLLNHQQIKEMSDGGMDIQSHSNTHAYFHKISSAAINEEMATSKSKIEEITGKPVTLLAYPGCSADYRSFDIAKNNGYTAAFSCGRYIDIKLDKKYYISRVHAYNDMESFVKMLSVGL